MVTFLKLLSPMRPIITNATRYEKIENSSQMPQIIDLYYFKVSFKHFPKQRRLDSETLSETDKLLKMKCNKKVLQNHLQMISGKVVTGRDISNIKAKSLSSKSNRNRMKSL
jgi:hypothetical protein